MLWLFWAALPNITFCSDGNVFLCCTIGSHYPHMATGHLNVVRGTNELMRPVTTVLNSVDFKNHSQHVWLIRKLFLEILRWIINTMFFIFPLHLHWFQWSLYGMIIKQNNWCILLYISTRVIFFTFAPPYHFCDERTKKKGNQSHTF